MPTGASITCQSDPTDEIIIEQDEADRFILRGYWAGQSRISVITDTDGLRSFARDALEMVGEHAADRPVKVGDRVTVVRALHGETVGRVGVIDSIDLHDKDLPYRIADDEGEFMTWAREVRRLAVSPDASPNPFTAYVEEAKRLLAGTAHTGGDVIELARELIDRA